MKNLKYKFISSLLATSILSGCAAKGFNTYNYHGGQGGFNEVMNRAVVSGNFNSMWDKLVRQLTESFFVVNNISKDSRLINVSFSSNSPEDYVDCGTTTRTYKRGDEEKNYAYPVASSSSYKYAYDSEYPNFAASVGDIYGSFAYNSYIDRETDLEGRINIYVAPNTKKQGTEIVANIRYILTITVKGKVVQEANNGQHIATWPVPDAESVLSFNTNVLSFYTNEVYSSKDNPPIVCFSKGVLEETILKMAGKASS